MNIIFILIVFIIALNNYINYNNFNNGDWGLGIGDWAQSPIPIPNPQKI